MSLFVTNEEVDILEKFISYPGGWINYSSYEITKTSSPKSSV